MAHFRLPRLVGLLLSLLFSGSIALAQTPSPAPPSQEKARLIREMLDVVGTRQLAAQMLDQMFESMKTAFPKVDPALWVRLRDRMLSRSLDELYIPIYDRHYSEADLRDILAFYRSPVGQRMLKGLPALLDESMKAGREWGRAIGQELQQEIYEEDQKNKKALEETKPGNA
jgi:uncharacterized protein